MKAGGGRQSWQREPEETVFTFSSLSAPGAAGKKKKAHTQASKNVPVLQCADINVRITQFTSVTLTDSRSEKSASAELLARLGTKT